MGIGYLMTCFDSGEKPVEWVSGLGMRAHCFLYRLGSLVTREKGIDLGKDTTVFSFVLC